VTQYVFPVHSNGYRVSHRHLFLLSSSEQISTVRVSLDATKENGTYVGLDMDTL
jgi:hypothetical protein